jgi:fumarate hydratase subunit beta
MPLYFTVIFAIILKAMGKTFQATPPMSVDDVSQYRAGDVVKLTGTIYTARDAAHKLIVKMIEEGKEPPFDLEGTVIYYVGPTPAKPGRVIGSAGPTTSYRMDPYSPLLAKSGVRMTIGKGSRGEEARRAFMEHKAVYCAAIGGAAALISQRITGAEVIAFEELGAEAVRRLTVEEFPVVVVNDVEGNDLFRQGMNGYRRL